MSGALASVTREICSNVQEQSRVWQRLIELTQQQHAALERQDVHSVHAVLQEIELVMLDRSRAEVRRSILLTQAATLLDINVEDVTRELLVTRSDEATGAALDTAAEQLRALATQLDALVIRNKAMLEQELSIIEVLVQGATVDTSARATYGKHGQQHDGPRLRLLDAQV